MSKSFTFELTITGTAEVTVEGVASLEEAEVAFERWKETNCYPAHNGWHLDQDACDGPPDWNFEQEAHEA